MRSFKITCIAVLLSASACELVGAQGPTGGTSPPNTGPQPMSSTTTSIPKEQDKCISYVKSDYGEKNSIGDLGDHWSVGSKATASFFRYNLATEKASFNERTLGLGLSFRYYSEDQLKNADGATSIQNVPKACRARTEDLLDFARDKSDGTRAKVGSWISISPTLFVSKAETDADVSIQPAIVVGLLNDIISIGTAYNLSGVGQGQWSILIGPSYGFQW
jgi:hypothetical protein